MFSIIKSPIVKKQVRKYFRTAYRSANHLKNLFLDSSPKWVVLVYHRIGSEDVFDPSDMRLSLKTFMRQITALARTYPIVSLSEALRHIREGKDLSPIQLVLTFDDGYQDNYDIVFPFLYRQGIPATFFLSTNWIDSKNDFITWKEAKEMKEKGMEIGSHGLSHHSLTQLSYPEAVSEIRESKIRLEQNLGGPCHHFAFPFGSKKDFNDSLIEEVKKANYQTCLLNIHGYNSLKDSHFCLKRIIMDEYTPVHYLLG